MSAERFKSYPVIVATRGSTLSPTERLVLVHVAMRADPNCWASVETLAEDTGLGERTIRRALRQLTAAGVLEVVPDPSRRTITYAVILDRILRREGATVTEDPATVTEEPATLAPNDPGHGDLLPGHQGEGALPPETGEGATVTYDPSKEPSKPSIPSMNKDTDGPPPGTLLSVPAAADVHFARAAAYLGGEVNPAVGREPSGGPSRSSKDGQKLATAIRRHGLETVLDAMRYVVDGQTDHAAFLRRQGATGTPLKTILAHIEQYADNWRNPARPRPPPEGRTADPPEDAMARRLRERRKRRTTPTTE